MNEMNQKIKNETFFEFINSKTPDEQSAIKIGFQYNKKNELRKKVIFTKVSY
jgi:hypothetical protein